VIEQLTVPVSDADIEGLAVLLLDATQIYAGGERLQSV
jgi:hypothetical protein